MDLLNLEFCLCAKIYRFNLILARIGPKQPLFYIALKSKFVCNYFKTQCTAEDEIHISLQRMVLISNAVFDMA
jgi:hypothetical protein